MFSPEIGFRTVSVTIKLSFIFFSGRKIDPVILAVPAETLTTLVSTFDLHDRKKNSVYNNKLFIFIILGLSYLGKPDKTVCQDDTVI